MEQEKNVRQKSRRVNLQEAEVPILKDLFKVFCDKVNNMDSVSKVNLIYTYLTKKKPDPTLHHKKKLDRILYELEFGDRIKQANEAKKKKFNWPAKWKSIMKKSKKDKNRILILYYTQKGLIIPMLIPIWSGNIVIINNKPYEVDPRAFWRIGKYTCMSFKEIDRRPISNLDYNEVVARGDSTHSDEILIKTVLRAAAKGGLGSKPVNKKALVVIGLIAIGALIFFMSK